MTNITITMDEETARWVRVEAAKAGKSVSRWLGELLAERRKTQAAAAWEAGREARMAAGARFLASPLRPISDNGKLPTREELYDEVLRRHERAGVREGQSEPFEAEVRKPVD
jgi:negative regulator of replication initiation